jgi:GT2 family glycosyltransferase
MSKPSQIQANAPQTDLTVSVIIPVYKGGKDFRQCLLSVKHVEGHAHEIIVVADGKGDGSWRLGDQLGMKVVRISGPGGPARARNAGAKEAGGNILFFVDADVTIPKDAITRIRSAFNHDPGLAALMGSYDDEPGKANFLSQYKNLFHHYVHQKGKEDASTFWGACGAIRRDIFLAMGGFDETYRKPSIEDIELGYRLKRAGYRIRLLKGLQVKHLKRWNILSLLKADFLCRALPWTDLILRDKRFINDLNLGYGSRMSVAAVYMLLITLVLSLWWPKLLLLAAVLALILLLINIPVYLFFMKKRGAGFVLKTLPWHWFYFFYSGLAFAIGLARYRMREWRLKRAKARSPELN